MRGRDLTALSLLVAAVCAALAVRSCMSGAAPDRAAPSTHTAAQPAAVAPPPRSAAPVRAMADEATWHGRVLDTSGQPVAAATVLAVPPSEFASRQTVAREDGCFTLPADLPPGALRLLAHHPDFLVTNLELSWPPAAPLDVVVRRRPALRVTVRGRDGAPVESFAALLQPADAEPRPLAALTAPPQPHPAGVLTLSHDQPGDVLVTITAPGFVPARIALGLRADAVAESEVWLDLGAQLRGVLLDQRGDAVADAAVTLLPSDPSLPRAEVTTDPAGRFELHALAPGSYEVRAFRDGLPQLREPELRVLARREPQDLVLRLPAGARVHGLVRGVRALELAEVVIAHADGPVRRTPLGPGGSYLFDNLTPGVHRLTIAYASSPVLRQLALVDGLPLAMSLELAAGQDLGFDFDDPWQALARVVGRLPADAATRGLRVVATYLDLPLPQRLAGLLVGLPEADGQFAIESLLPGRWSLAVHSGDQVIERGEVLLPAGGEVRWPR